MTKFFDAGKLIGFSKSPQKPVANCIQSDNWPFGISGAFYGSVVSGNNANETHAFKESQT